MRSKLKLGNIALLLASSALALLLCGPFAGLVASATIRWIYAGCMIAAFPVGWLFPVHAGRFVLRNVQRIKILLDLRVMLMATDAANREDHR